MTTYLIVSAAPGRAKTDARRASEDAVRPPASGAAGARARLFGYVRDSTSDQRRRCDTRQAVPKARSSNVTSTSMVSATPLLRPPAHVTREGPGG